MTESYIAYVKEALASGQQVFRASVIRQLMEEIDSPSHQASYFDKERDHELLIARKELALRTKQYTDCQRQLRSIRELLKDTP